MDPQVKLAFQGDERDLTRSLGKVADVGQGSMRTIERSASDAEKALKGVQQAATGIRPVDVKVTADVGAAESDIRNVGDSAHKVDVPVVANTSKAEADIKGLTGKKVDVPVSADTSKAKEALKGLGDLGTDVGDKFSGGMASSLKGGIAGAVAGVGTMIVESIADKINESRKIERALELKLHIPRGEAEKVTDLFQTNPAEDLGKWGSAVPYLGDVDVKALGEAGRGANELAETYVRLKGSFKDFSGMAIADQRALTVEMEKTAQVGGVDVIGVLKGAEVASRVWGLSAWDSTRLVEKGFDELGPRADDWAETLNEYSGYFQNFGLSSADMFNIVKQGMDAGAMSTDKVADAWKELGIRIIDQVPEVSGALKQMGLDAAQVPAAIAAGGPPAREALDSVIDKLREVKNPIEQNKLGLALFGTQWEDTMRRAVNNTDIIKQGVNNLGYAITTLPDGRITVTANTAPARNAAEQAVRDINTFKASFTVVGKLLGMPGLIGHAKGGWVRGAGTRTSDSNLRAVSNDEFVMNAASANKGDNPAILEAMNSGASLSGGSFTGPPARSSGGGGGPSGVSVQFVGDTDSAFATAFMRLVRDGSIQLGSS